MRHEDFYIKQQLEKDNSFREKISGIGALFGGGKSQLEERKIWERGVKHGFQQGIDYTTDKYNFLNVNNINTPKQQEFIDKLYQLCGEYDLRISWHPLEGMVLQQLSPTYVSGIDLTTSDGKSLGGKSS